MDLQSNLYAIPPVVEFLISVVMVFYVLSKDLKKANKVFALLMFFVALWSLTVFLQRISADHETALSFVSVRYYFMIPIPLILSYFTLIFPEEKNMRLHKYPLASLMLFAVSMMFLVPYMVSEVELGYWGYRAIFNREYTHVITLFITYMAVSSFYVVYNLLESYKTYGVANTSQIKCVIIGCLLSLSTIIIVETLRMVNIFLVPMSDIFFLPLALCVAYAMIRYKFMSIVPEFENEAETESIYQLKNGNSYIIKEGRPKKSIDVFVDSLTHGRRGLCITRMKPEKLKRIYNLHKTPIIWMTDIESAEESIEPTDIDGLYALLLDFIEKFDGSIILIKRLDYLITRNGYDRILKFIQSLNDKIASSNCTLLLSLNPFVLDNRQLELLEQEFINLFEFKEVKMLPEHLHNLLEYIYRQNITRKPVAFKNISEKFSISKTTTGQRIHELEQKGLVEVRKEGRYKMLIVTEDGRKIFGD